MRCFVKPLALGLSLLATSVSHADEGHSALNTVGRFLGMGYTYNGYHSRADGRFGFHARPAHSYPSTALTSIYLPQNYARPSNPFPFGMSQRAVIANPQAIAPITPVPAPMPVGPPPQWLEPYLKGNSSEQNTSRRLPEEVARPQPSREPLGSKSPIQSSLLESESLERGSPDGGLLDLDGDLLESDGLIDGDVSPSDDDDLLLLDDDLSTQHDQLGNRYNQAQSGEFRSRR